MADSFFKVPKTGSGQVGDSYRPKYSDEEGIEGYSVKREFPEESEFIVLFEGDEDVLDEIAEKEDATRLNEAQVGKLIQGGTGRGPTEDGPQPPKMGEGETLEERLEDFIENTTGSSFVIMGGKGVYSKPLVFRRSPGFHDGNFAFFDLDQMRKIPRYLIDTILRPEAAVILPEHYDYWIWTTKFVEHALSNSNVFDTLTETEDTKRSDLGYSNIILDFINTVNILAYPRRVSSIQDQRVVKFVQMMTGFSNKIKEPTILRLFGPNSLAVLDGLIKRRCGLNDDGNIVGSSVVKSWYEGNPEDGSLSYYDRLQYWRTQMAKEPVQQTLDTINDLQRYDLSYLRRMGGVLGNTQVLDEELKSNNNFLRIVGKGQRNYNIHGQGSAPLIAPIVISLSCLVFWDLIDVDTYRRHQEELLRKIRQS